MLQFLAKRCFSYLLKEQGASLASLRAFEATDSAVERLQELRQKFPKQTLRIAVEPGGCHGFQYKFILDQAVAPEDMYHKASFLLLIFLISFLVYSLMIK